MPLMGLTLGLGSRPHPAPAVLVCSNQSSSVAKCLVKRVQQVSQMGQLVATCRCQRTELMAGDRRNRAHLLYTILSFTEAELETFWVPQGIQGR